MTYYMWCLCGTENKLRASELRRQGHTVIDTSKDKDARQRALKLGLTRSNRVVYE